MATKLLAGKEIEVNEEGYLVDIKEWTEDIAEAIAKEEEIEELTDNHWKVLKYLQEYFQENDSMPTIRRLKKSGIVGTKELYSLFPGGPLKKSSKIAGLKKPESCI